MNSKQHTSSEPSVTSLLQMVDVENMESSLVEEVDNGPGWSVQGGGGGRGDQCFGRQTIRS